MKDLGELTLEQKASLTSGADFWNTQAVPDAGIPAIMMTDGPHGLRKQAGASDHLGLAASVPATCFPPAVALGCSWDAALAERVGRALGVESAIEDVAVILGPGVNIKRTPLCGRNFEYFSEDPIVAGVMGCALVRGIQSQGVGASLKHFAANNQETERLRVSADVAPRPLREIYLRAFQRVVRDAQPWTVMCSYNRVNGEYASQNRWLLTEVLRDEWGFDGLVVSDWGAVEDRVKALAAGLDLEMPSSGGRTDAQVAAAVADGALEEDVLDTAVARVLDLVDKSQRRPAASGPLDVEAHHALAREAAARSIVLLKNEDALLPLRRDAGIAVIGAFADEPRYQGAGSSRINPTKLDDALGGIRELATGTVTYSAGFTLDDTGDAAALRADAVAAASAAEIAVVFLGLPAAAESEGYDRAHIDLPAEQLNLLDAVLAANPRTVVVLSNGGVVALPFRDAVPAILEGWLLGQAGGSAIADVLFGAVNPSGKLTETIPLRLEDTPAYGNFPGEHGHVSYGEGLLVGYRWYDARDMRVAYPFGHGLSYTTFSYGQATAEAGPDGDITVTVPVTNTGALAGREVVQVYSSLPGSAVQRPPQELKGFSVVELAPGQSADAVITVRRDDLAYWDTRLHAWVVESGRYTLQAAASSRDIRATVDVQVDGDAVRLPVSLHSTFEEAFADPEVGPLLRARMEASSSGTDSELLTMLANFPLGRLDGFPLPRAELEQVVREANAS